MHELAIAQSIADVIEDQAKVHHAARVQSIKLRIGEAHAVVFDSLAYCFAMLASNDPLLKGAQLQIETVPHRARCQQCADEFAVSNFVAQCPRCQAWSSDIISGTEFQIAAMEFEP